MSILFVSFCPPQGVIADLYVQLASQLSRRLPVAVLHPRHLDRLRGPFVAQHLVDYTRSRPGAILSPASLAILRQVRAAGYDLVLFFNQHVLNIPVALAARGARCVMWWHEPYALGRQPLARRLVYAANDAFLASRSARIIVACEAMRSQVPAKLAGRVAVVPLPFLDAFAQELPAASTPPSGAEMLFFGTVEPYKGLDLLAQAWELLYSRGTAPRLRVIGPGPVERVAPRMATLAQRFPELIRLTNSYAPHEEIAQAVAASRAVILPYLSAMGTTTVQVANYYGRPVIATRVGCLQHYVVAERTGLLVPPGDPTALAQAMERLAIDEDLAERLGAQGRAFFEQFFASDAILRQIEDICHHGQGHHPY
jgi:glycosyltransferase involved in cell wall biosynthesis